MSQSSRSTTSAAAALLLVVGVLLMPGSTTVYVAASPECDLSVQERLESLVSNFPTKFDPVKDFRGNPFCAKTTPTVSLPLGKIANIADSVRLSGKAQCALYCQNAAGCVGFNFQSTAAADGSQCDLFTKAANSCQVVPDGSCQYYEVPGNPTVCTDVTGFTYMPLFKVYYLAITTRMTQDQAYAKCMTYGPKSHLAILRNTDADYAGMIDFINNSGTKQICSPGDWDGYWLGLHRERKSCNTRYVWDRYNSLESATPVLDSSSSKEVPWVPGAPDCNGNIEFSSNIAVKQNMRVNDVGDSMTTCVLCQVFV